MSELRKYLLLLERPLTLLKSVLRKESSISKMVRITLSSLSQRSRSLFIRGGMVSPLFFLLRAS